MAECDSHNMYQNLNPIPLSPNISNDQQFRLNKINEIKDYFIADIREREVMSTNLSFDYLDKPLILLPVVTGSISIASFATDTGVAVGIMSVRCSLLFSITRKKSF